MSVLQQIALTKQTEIQAAKQVVSINDLRARFSDVPAARAFLPPTPRTGKNAHPDHPSDPSHLLSLVLEIKPASPSQGNLAQAQGQAFDPAPYVQAYAPFACALSVLTDAPYFGGSLALLAQVRALTALPLLRKDFILDAYQLFEARAHGADAVLLIAKLLTDDALYADLAAQARALGLTPVLEVQTEQELSRTLSLIQPGDAVLINNRNLDTLVLDLQTTPRLAALIPEAIAKKNTIISASGITSVEDLDLLRQDAQTFLIGSHLMKLPVAQIPEVLHALTRERDRV
ncbi:MAG: indole-3-glycerol phosphate synthase TrpC [Vampirovibrionales bacterium]|nr:indole-3-glycerol phosphate synthase TrpC [Vampirovibrionales bacterium]